MIPIIWRYLLGQYLKVFTLCVAAFISILLTARLDDIAHFAALGSDGWTVIKFVLYQIPYILPIVIPISCLISVLLLIQRLSRTHELTALRACGLAIRDILTPLLIAASLLSIGNFYIVSEMATTSHLKTNLLKSQIRAINPLLLLHNKHLRKMRGIYFDTLGASKMGELASDVVIAMPDKENRRINLMIAKEMHAKPKTFTGKGVTMITSLGADDSEQFDPLMLENLAETTITIKDFSQVFQKSPSAINYDQLRMPLLLVRLQEAKQNLPKAKEMLTCCYSEIIRRISVALAVFTFTLMGAAFGISISRNRSNKGLYLVIVLAALYLMAYFSAKGVENSLALSSVLYLVPHILIIALSIGMLKRVTKGIAS